MTEDKRIVKTKTELRAAIVSLIQKAPFEKLTVKGICEKAKISRLTFYANYRDKYDLLNDVFCSFQRKVLADCEERDRSNNPENDLVMTSKNLLVAIVNCFYDNGDLVKAVSDENNPYVKFAFHTFVRRGCEHLILDKVKEERLRHPLPLTVAFLCNGLTAFLSECFYKGLSREEAQSRCGELINDLLSEKVLLKNAE